MVDTATGQPISQATETPVKRGRLRELAGRLLLAGVVFLGTTAAATVGAGVRQSVAHATNTDPWDAYFLYGVGQDGNLYCFRHNGYASGQSVYTPGAWQFGGPVSLGGWDAYAKVFSVAGAIYGIDQNGNLMWYKHDGFVTCDDHTVGNWEGPNQVGTGWGDFTQVFGMTVNYGIGLGGVIYAVDSSGELLWYRHDGYATGDFNWEGPHVVGYGWGDFTHIFAGSDGVIYAINTAGELLWYKHDGYQTGDFSWEGPKVVGRGFGDYTQVMAGPHGVIYAVNKAGDLLWLKHDGYQTGDGMIDVSPVSKNKIDANSHICIALGTCVAAPSDWEGPNVVRYGWEVFTHVFLRSPEPVTPL